MITYLPHKDFKQALECLSLQHLTQTSKDAYYIILVIEAKNSRQFYHGIHAHSRHPSTLMWESHLDTLKLYYNMSLIILTQKLKLKLEPPKLFQGILSISTPPWLGDTRLHQTHRNLLMNSSRHYEQFGWTQKAYANGLYWPS